jgi:predicted metal-dependent phosphoesterase TrpH
LRIDLHIHTKTGSDGKLTVGEVLQEARSRGIDLISITDHDSVEAQSVAMEMAQAYGMAYITGVELNVTFPYKSKVLSLDFLGYRFDPDDRQLGDKLKAMSDHRITRGRQILDRLNTEFAKEGIEPLTDVDLENIQRGVDGTFGRPHIANYLIAKGIVKGRQEAFDKYLVKCDVPKYPLSLSEASRLVRGAGGFLSLAHPNDPNGTSLAVFTPNLDEQTGIIREAMLGYIGAVECWHPRHNADTVRHYVEFARNEGLMMTGGSDCHQEPVIMGSLDIPLWVAEQFTTERRSA